MSCLRFLLLFAWFLGGCIIVDQPAAQTQQGSADEPSPVFAEKKVSETTHDRPRHDDRTTNDKG